MKKLEEGKMFLLSEIFLEKFVIVVVNLGMLSEIFILRVKFRIESKAIAVKEPSPIHAEGTWIYIILTLSPCK